MLDVVDSVAESNTAYRSVRCVRFQHIERLITSVACLTQRCSVSLQTVDGEYRSSDNVLVSVVLSQRTSVLKCSFISQVKSVLDPVKSVLFPSIFPIG